MAVWHCTLARTGLWTVTINKEFSYSLTKSWPCKLIKELLLTDWAGFKRTNQSQMTVIPLLHIRAYVVHKMLKTIYIGLCADRERKHANELFYEMLHVNLGPLCDGFWCGFRPTNYQMCGFRPSSTNYVPNMRQETLLTRSSCEDDLYWKGEAEKITAPRDSLTVLTILGMKMSLDLVLCMANCHRSQIFPHAP